ncbi:hypothetical protein H1R16_02925 [Marnyiella aurantia]|uniref:Uncharacterized protein n=1 Tax=Marnyiella aurantia TaxID=2758037 RepID=A0A7D7LST2_9FLAO|nr:hypothetical protein [Marnyiella aurantia]MBA5245612.1 hypothetical protein [Marnyiella aurantia]QMS98978.1 hypothetical protein H1R16_02925 [Marnyiella aurantia]
MLDFEYEYTEIVGDGYCIGEAEPLFYPPFFGHDQAFPAEMFKFCTRAHQKIEFRLIVRNKKQIHPFVSDVKIWNYNPQNGRAEISRYWNTENLSEGERHFFADRSGKRIPVEYDLPADSDSSEIRERIDKLIWVR